MAKKSSTDDISLILKERSLNQDMYETTYKSAYGRFYPEDNNRSYNNIQLYKKYATNNLTNYKYKFNSIYHKNKNLENYIKTSQENIPQKNPKLVCPNCFNENILRTKSMNRLKKRQIYETEYFEDKMKMIHENKKKEDIKNRENRSKNTYISLFKNRDRSAKMYKNMTAKDKKDEYFVDNIDYGMLRCRNRELKNDKKLFGLYLCDNNNKNKNSNNNIEDENDNKKSKINNLKTNKSWLCPKNYVLDKKEYSFIIDRQIEKANIKLKKERYEKIKEEKTILNSQINKEKNKLDREICCKKKKRNEINKINCNLLKIKKYEEYKQKRLKNQEKECINLICKKQLDEMIKKFRQFRLKNKNVENENKKIAENKQMQNKKEKMIMNRNDEGLSLKEVEKKSCENCNRLYPKNVLSYMYYTYNEQQNDNKNIL